MRPLHVISALHRLVTSNQLYKKSFSNICEHWIQSITADCNETVADSLGLNTEMQTTNEKELDEGNETDDFTEVDENDKILGSSDTLLDSADPSAVHQYTFAPERPISLEFISR